MIFNLLADYRPFLDPLPVWRDSVWPWLLVPLCLAVATVYKSIRCKTMSRVPREAAVLTLFIVLGMAGAAMALYIVVRKIVE